MAWGIAESWEAAVEVTAAAYRVEPRLLRAESQGRGPRPPLRAREAKKVAAHITIVVSDCAYSDLARAIGYHRDTICSACADVRDACDDDAFEERLVSIEQTVRLRLGAGLHPPAELLHEELTLRALLLGLRAEVRALADKIDFVGLNSVHPTKTPDHENVIILSDVRGGA